MFSVIRLFLIGWMLSFSLGIWAQNAEPVNSTQESAQKQELKQEELPFNALEHLLQKPAKNEKFASKRFGDHLFFAGEGGITMLRNTPSWFRTPGIGLRSGISVGDWFTPVHGARLGINVGLHNGTDGHDPYFVGVSADYLMNLSALLRKDNPARMFELIGVAGLEYQLLYRHAKWAHAGGFRLGMQTRFNISPLSFFYLEPRFGIYTDAIDEVKTWRKWDWEGSVMAGFGYRLLSDPVRKREPFVGNGRGFFLSAGGGLSALWRNPMKFDTDLGWTTMLALGHQFTPVSSLRLLGSVHYFQHREPWKYHKASFGLQLDYLFNMHSLFGGNDPSRIFELSGILGGGLHDVSTGYKQGVTWSVGAGLHGAFNVNDHWSIFLEPRMDFFDNYIWRDPLAKADYLSSLSAGVTYYPVARSIGHVVKGEDFDFHSPLGNLYITAGGGYAGILAASLAEPLLGNGYRVAAGVGTQWNAISGARAMMTFTSLDNSHYTIHRTLGVGAQLDYMLYFSNLFWGYNPNRLFEVNGLLGLNYDYISAHKYGHSIAFGAGIQGTFRLGDMFELYLEPRLHAGSNNKWERGLLSRIDVIPTFMAGVNYNLYGYSRKHNIARANEPFSNESFSDHVFMGIGVGGDAMLHREYFTDLENRVGPMASVFVGKWFTPASGLRLSANGALFGDKLGGFRKAAIADVSYLWNINSTLYGYNPSRIFETRLGVGASLAFVTGKHVGFYPGLNLNLQGLWRLNPNWGIFLEPQLRFFDEKFSVESFAGMPFDIHTAMQAGVQYQLDGYDIRTNRAVFEKDPKNYFFSAAYTARMLKRAAFDTGHGAALAFGKWYTPLSAWRVGVDFGSYGEHPRYRALSLSADYLFNLSAYMWQYNPDRVFDLLAIAGLSVGAANDQNGNEVAVGLKAGLQGRFNLSSHIDLFVEPELIALRRPTGFTPEARLMAGLNYKMGRKGDGNRKNELEKKNFISVSGGASMFSETILMAQTRRVSGAFDISYGRWFSHTSGLQIGYGYDPTQLSKTTTLKLNSLHLDYLLNLTALFNTDPKRPFDLVGAAGTGLGWCGDKTSWLGEGRLQFRWNASKSATLYLEPSMTIWGDKLNRDNTHNFIGTGRLSAGLAIRF